MISPITNSKNTRYLVNHRTGNWTTHSSRKAAVRHIETNLFDETAFIILTFRQMVRNGYMNENGQVVR